MTDRGDVTTLGILALRHGDLRDAKGNAWGFFPLVNFAAEWTVTTDEDGLLVEIPKKDTLGVLLGGINWPFAPGGDRRVTEWSWAFPSLVDGPARVRPVRTVKDGYWKFDDTLAVLAAAEPAGVRYPVGWPGVVCAGTELTRQEAAFVPGFLGLVAPHFGGPANLGTSVFELSNQGGLTDRAFLQSFMRLYEVPADGPPTTQAKPPNWAGPFGGIPPMSGQDGGDGGGAPGGSPNWAGGFGGIPPLPDPGAGDAQHCLAWQLGTAKGGFYGRGVVADFVAPPAPPKPKKKSGDADGLAYDAEQLAKLQALIAIGGAGEFGGVGTPQSGIIAIPGDSNTGPHGESGGVGTFNSPASLPNSGTGPYGEFGGVGTPQSPASIPGVPQSQFANPSTATKGPTPGTGTTTGGSPPPDPNDVSKDPKPTDAMSQVLAAMSKSMSGPVDVGDLKDQHQHWINSKGEPMNAAHLSTNVYFKRGAQDCPLEFGGLYGKPQDLGGTEIRVELCYDGQSQHPFVKGSRTGLWRWKTKVPVDTWEPEYPPPPDIPEYPGITRRREGGGQIAGGGRIAGSWNEWGVPALLGMAQSTHAAVPDLRNRDALTDDRARQAKANMPVTARLEAFGRQLGESWAYTTRPGASRYPTGTVPGGFVVLPPELGMEQIASGREPEICSPTNLTLYRSKLGIGKPDEATGGTLQGHVFEGDRRGTTTLSAVNAAGTAREVLRLTPAGASFARAGQLVLRTGLLELRGEKPVAGEVFVATDQRALYVALAAGAWTQVAAMG